MFLELRKKAGIAKKHFYDRYQKAIESVYGDVLRELEQEGLLANEENRVYLIPGGIFLGNNVLERFSFEK